MDPTSSTEDDPFLTISEDLVPSAPLPTSTIISLPLSNLLNPPLRLQTNVSECGGQLWPAGMVLSEYLIRHHLEEMRGKTMFNENIKTILCSEIIFFGLSTLIHRLPPRRLELGTGSGLVGLAIALALCQTPPGPSPSTITHPPYPLTTIHLTDGTPALIPLISSNIALNNLSQASSIRINPHLLPWGSPHHPLLTHKSPPDVLLAADCVYYEPAFPLLEATIAAAMRQHTVMWFCYLRRRRRDVEMIQRLEKDKGLVVREVDVGELGGRYARGSGMAGGRGKGGVVLFEVRRAEVWEREREGG